MNAFQELALSRLNEELSSLGLKLKDIKARKSILFDEPDPPDEYFIEATIDGTDVEVIIYDDEAQYFSGKHVDCRFETPDFDSSSPTSPIRGVPEKFSGAK